MKKVILVVLFLILAYTRLFHLNWGGPFPFHPDENNMVRAIQQLECPNIFDPTTCLNPHFFAYGQPPLYGAYFLNQVTGTIDPRLALRLISALASILNAYVLLKILEVLISPDWRFKLLCFFMIIFSPYFIQFSRFGTTESSLMLLYSLIVYFSLKLFSNEPGIFRRNFLAIAITSGLAIATKFSALPFLGAPLLALFLRAADNYKISLWRSFRLFLLSISLLLILVAVFLVIFSPHNLISNEDFLSTMNFETSVGQGLTKVFYTRQFEFTIPFLFQSGHIFPYVLGWPVFIFSVLGFIFSSWKNEKINLLRFALLIYLVPSVFLYAKWTRFISPVFPIMTLMALIGIHTMLAFLQDRFHMKKIWLHNIYVIFTVIIIIPGLAYLAIYSRADVRLTASEWIYHNIPDGAYVLSETANVVDIPVPMMSPNQPIPNYTVISFDFYHLDENLSLQEELESHLAQADYIFVPSRRIFSDHTCLWPGLDMSRQNGLLSGYSLERCAALAGAYPKVNEYYRQLFNGELGFQLVAEFSSYPRIEWRGRKFLKFPDEMAEETWTVFDHPVIRIYKRS